MKKQFLTFNYFTPLVLSIVLVCSLDVHCFIYSGAEWLFKKGTEPILSDTAQWRNVDYDDSDWQKGVTPFFYGELLNGTRLNDMTGNYTSIYLRKKFTLYNLENVKSFELRVLSDDGCIVWLNGIEILRFNMPVGEIPYDGTALPPLPEPISWQSKIIREIKQYLKEGDNVIAVHAFNSSLDQSSDFAIDCELILNSKDNSPYIVRINPVENALLNTLTNVEVVFSEEVYGVDQSSLIANGIHASSYFQENQFVYRFGFSVPFQGKVLMS